MWPPRAIRRRAQPPGILPWPPRLLHPRLPTSWSESHPHRRDRPQPPVPLSNPGQRLVAGAVVPPASAAPAQPPAGAVVLEGLAKGSYYVQIGVYETDEALQNAARNFAVYPLAVEKMEGIDRNVSDIGSTSARFRATKAASSCFASNREDTGTPSFAAGT